MKNLFLLLPILFISVMASATLPPITGTTGICGGTSTTLSNATSGGTWTSSNTAIATVGASSGIVTGMASGTATISYTVGVDVAVTTVTVISSPPTTLGGCNNIGVGDTLNYGETFGCSMVSPTSYMFSTSNYSVASAVAWAVIGVAPGSVTVYMYGSTGCMVGTRNITVTPTRLISKITGNTILCPGNTATLANATAGGIWTSGSPSIATISTTGVTNAITPGYSAITYSLPATTVNCLTNVLVHQQPTPFAGPTSVCTGDSIVLSSSFIGYCTDVGLGGWFSSGDTSIAKNTGGKFKGINPGTVTITYTGYQSPGCTRTAVLTVNPASVAPITGAASVCVGASTTLTTSTPGGSWSSAAPGIATITSTGVVTGIVAGTATITYTINNVCGIHFGTAVVTVNPLPVAGTITGSSTVCAAASTAFTASLTGGVWSSSNTSISTVNVSGNVTGVAAGTALISYSVTNGCGIAIATKAITVNPLPVAGTITGATAVCVAATATLTSSVSGGSWSVSGTAATIVSGIVTGVSAGTAIISYTVTNGCGTAVATHTMTGNPLPVAGTLTGSSTVCAAASTALAASLTGGVWTSSNVSVATVDASGNVTGVAASIATISYSVTNGCGTAIATKSITVNPLPVAGTISGATTVCPGATGTLTSSSSGGVWSSSDVSAATIGTSGLVTGVSAGTTIISYTVTNGCGTDVTTHAMTVNPLPVAGAIAGDDSVCAGAHITLSATTAGGTWSSSNVGVATIDAAGVVAGIVPGTVIITYTVTNGCGTTTTTHAITVVVTYLPSITISVYPGSYDTFVATVTGAGPAPSYQWSNNGVMLAGATSATYITNTLHDGDSVCCKVYGTLPCGLEAVSCTIVHFSAGIATVSPAIQMALFPNPNDGMFTIKGVAGNNNPMTIEVRNMMGQLLLSERYTPVNGAVNKQLMMDRALPSGSYVLSVISEEGNSLLHSGFIIRH
jgi:uncharacterized protein YjdB